MIVATPPSTDDIGALYYVVAVILIYGLSIVLMIASHIRKNKQDNQLKAYLKVRLLPQGQIGHTS